MKPKKISDRRASGGGPLSLASLLVVIGAALVLTHVRYRPPSALGVDASAERFSAGRALPILEDLVGDGIPHPVESAQNAVVRERVVDHLERAGWTPHLQEAVVRSRRGDIALVNVMARLDGTADGSAVVLAAHYDSVPEGPGAADDGVAVAAILEIARMLAAAPAPRNDVIILITDGEEAGLLGARAFVDEHPWAGDVAVVVNLEARGTSGPSLMFQTSDDDAWLIDLFGDVVARPCTGSVFVEIYERLPNDTDFTIFKKHGLAGYNFAFIGDVKNYHTPNDSVGNVDLGSLQHHGDNALALVRALSRVDLSAIPSGRAVYFDVFAYGVIGWPTVWTTPLALVAAGSTLIAMFAARRRSVFDFTRGTLALILTIAVLLGATLVVVVIGRVLEMLGAFPSPWVDRPLPVVAVFWTLAVLVAALVTSGARSLGVWPMWSGVWSGWALLALVLAVALPAASYLILVPALVAGVAAAAVAVTCPARIGIASLAGIAAAAALWFPLERLLYDAVGFGIGLRHAAMAALFATTLVPAMAGLRPAIRSRVCLTLALVAAGAFVVAVVG